MEIPGPNIVLPGRSTSPTPVLKPAAERDGEGPGVCSLCLSTPSRYTCPRCNAPYCGLSCYQGPRHMPCSEAFYKEAVLQRLREEQAGPQGRREVEEMLLRLREVEGRREVEAGAGLDRYPGVNEEEAGLWGSLTPWEREDFQRLLRSGQIGALVPEWRPWWERGDEATRQPDLVTSCREGPEEKNPQITRFPGLTNGLTGYEERQEGDNQEFGSSNITTGRVPPGRETSDITTGHMGAGRQTTDIMYDVETRLERGIPRPSAHCNESADITSPRKGVAEERGHIVTNPVEEESDFSAESATLAIKGDVSERERASGAKRELPAATRQPGLSEVPPVSALLPSLRSLSRDPSPLVRFSLVNAIYGYAFSLQRQNGDLSDNASLADFTETLLGVSSALSSAAVYSSTAHALQSAVQAASNQHLGADEGGACAAIAAVARILKGDGSKRYALAALAHLTRMLGRARKLAEDEEGRRAAFNAKKKCVFLAAWANEHESSLATLCEEARGEHERHLRHIGGVTEIARGLREAWGGEETP
ncbi:hypothetical protein FKM82_021253 [Ascaphus truei]